MKIKKIALHLMIAAAFVLGPLALIGCPPQNDGAPPRTPSSSAR